MFPTDLRDATDEALRDLLAAALAEAGLRFWRDIAPELAATPIEDVPAAHLPPDTPLVAALRGAEDDDLDLLLELATHGYNGDLPAPEAAS